jgi:hypothetical protein
MLRSTNATAAADSSLSSLEDRDPGKDFEGALNMESWSAATFEAMENMDFNKQLGRALVALAIGALVSALVRSQGGGKYLVAGMSGAAGTIAAVALLP